MPISINYARTAMCHKFHYIILYGNNISKLLSMHIIHDCETKFNIEVKENKTLNIWTVWCSLCTFPLKKKPKESDLEHVYPQKDKLRNPKIDYTAIGFHNGRMDTETFQHIDISKVKSIHELAIYTGLKSVSKLSSFSAVPDYFFFFKYSIHGFKEVKIW